MPVDKVRLLCAMNRFMMQEFSQRTVEALKQGTLFSLMLPPLQSFLEINLQKEVKKDQLVLTSAAVAHKTGKEADSREVQRLLQEARSIDRNFLRQASPFPINIDIQYYDIEEIRQQRIELMIEAATRLFARWETIPRFREAVASLYDAQQFRSLLYEILHLYSHETRMLHNSIHMPGIISMARNSLAQTIYSTMERVSAELAGELSRKVYRRMQGNG